MKSVSEQKEEFIREIEAKIFRGEYKVGEKLPTERELANEAGVNRSIASSALRALEEKGFIEIRPRHGMVVADYQRRGSMAVLDALLTYNEGHFTPEMLDMVFEARMMHETTIARYCARRRTKEDLERLSRHLEELKSAEDGRILGEALYSFYHEMAIATGNLVLSLSLQIFRGIYISLSESFYSKVGSLGLEEAFSTLMAEITAKHEAKAAAAASEIIKRQMEALKKQI